MKKTISLIAVLTMTLCAKASVYDSIAFPDHVIAREINDSGQITTEYVSDFIYGTDGQLTNYTFYTTIGDCQGSFDFYEYPNKPSQSLFAFYYSADDMTIYEKYSFDYENGLIKRKEIRRYADFFDFRYCWYYSYDNTHLSQEYYVCQEYHDVYQTRHLYTYENGYQTRIDQYYEADTSTLFTVTTTHYNNQHQILDSQTNSNTNSPISRKTYTYTPQNKTDYIITQTFGNETWVNSKIEHYVYDTMNRVIEYQVGTWSEEDQNWNINQKIIWDFNDETQTLTISFRKKDNDEWVWDKFRGQSLFNDSRLYEWQRVLNSCFYGGRDVNQFEINMHYDKLESGFIIGTEWYYNIVGDDGSITYQHLECVGDTLFDRGNKRPKVIVRSNTHYDRDVNIEVTHEYVYEDNGIVYWWNKDLQEFTTLYDYNAEIGDEWEIKVGTSNIIVHVDNVDVFEYQGETRKLLQISDANNIFNGDIVEGYGHMTSFFPEKLMNQGKGFRVDGLRCYWVEDALLYHNGVDDCDAIYSELHDVEENGLSAGSGTLTVYPNPANGVLFVRLTQCDSPTTGQTEYRITNLMGQTLLQGPINAETQQIDIANLPAGMYFINVGEQTVKFVVR